MDADLRAFDEWFKNKRGQQPLSNYERAAVKTFIAYKLGLGEEDECSR